ncbi:MAG: hypothetical protein QOI00_1875, partial [Chloroflexota bacterium]|nr:hypothetical protein [Chloroflexota bacterium]
GTSLWVPCARSIGPSCQCAPRTSDADRTGASQGRRCVLGEGVVSPGREDVHGLQSPGRSQQPFVGDTRKRRRGSAWILQPGRLGLTSPSLVVLHSGLPGVLSRSLARRFDGRLVSRLHRPWCVLGGSGLDPNPNSGHTWGANRADVEGSRGDVARTFQGLLGRGCHPARAVSCRRPRRPRRGSGQGATVKPVAAITRQRPLVEK